MQTDVGSNTKVVRQLVSMLVDIQTHLFRQVEVDAGMVRGWNCRLVNSGLKTYRKKVKRDRGAQDRTKNYRNIQCRYIYEMFLINWMDVNRNRNK